jgi:charged multivesicular body protein 3
MEDMVNETVDSALDSEDVEDDIEEEVDKVLAALGAETASRLPVPAAQRIKKDSMSRVPGHVGVLPLYLFACSDSVNHKQ